MILSMSPTTLHVAAAPNSNPVKAPALAIGSLSTAQDGKYQSLISELEGTRQVEKQLLDRLIDQGTYSLFFYKSTFVNFPSHLFTTFILWIRPYHSDRVRLRKSESKAALATCSNLLQSDAIWKLASPKPHIWIPNPSF